MALIGYVWLFRQLGYGWFEVETCEWGRKGQEVCGLWNKEDLIDAVSLLIVGKLVVLKSWFGPKWFPKWFE